MSIRNFSFFYLFLGATCMAQVSLTEIGAISSERLISRNEAGIQRLGSGAQWFDLDFDDSRWEIGANPIGYGFETPVTDVREAIEGKTPTLYYRQTFTLTAEQAASTETLSLEMDYNDGYVAYLNGMELRRRFCAAEGAYLYHDQPAFGTVRSTDSPNTFSFTDSSNYLREGENVLAVEIHNASLDSPELKLATALQTPSTTLIAAGASGRWKKRMPDSVLNLAIGSSSPTKQQNQLISRTGRFLITPLHREDGSFLQAPPFPLTVSYCSLPMAQEPRETTSIPTLDSRHPARRYSFLTQPRFSFQKSPVARDWRVELPRLPHTGKRKYRNRSQ